MEQMWISRTPILYGGKYDEDGVFLDIVEINMVKEGRFNEWEKANEEKLRKLVRVLEMIRELVKQVAGGKCVIVHQVGREVLEVYGVCGEYACGLPADVLARWDVQPK